MPNVFQIGPLVLPVSLLFMFAAVAASGSIGKWARRSAGIDVEPILFQTLVVGLVVARLAFVLQFGTAYRASPLAVFDIRDGGWRPLAGFAAAWIFALGRQFKRPALRKPLLAAVFTATAIWAAVSLPRFETMNERPCARANQPARGPHGPFSVPGEAHCGQPLGNVAPAVRA